MTSQCYLPATREELDEAVAWYEGQQSGVGLRLVASVRQAIAELRDHPDSCPVVRDDVRRKRVRQFPYDLLFVIEDHVVLIVAVAHHHRNPDYWTDRL